MRILIIKPSALGDVATTLPLLCDLKAALPEAGIDWLIHPAYAPLIEGHDALHQIIPFDRKNLAAWWYKPSAFRLFRQLLHTLRDNHYDVVIDAQGLLRSGFLARVSGAAMRIGFADAREGGNLFYTHKIPIRRCDAVAVVRMRSLLDPLGIPHDGPPQYRVPLDPQTVASVNALVPEHSIGLIPGSRGKGKRWPGDAFAAVISILAENHPIVLFGSPDERSLCDQIVAQSGSEGHARINLAGQTSIAEVTAAINRCDLIIGNDTGPLHVAVALGKTVIGLYGRTDPKSVGPYGQLENVIRFSPGEPWQSMWRTVIGRVAMIRTPPSGRVRLISTT
jgi:heptosyltransferase I